MYVYEENDTMKRIANHKIANIYSHKSEFFDVLNAYSRHPEYGIVQMCFDIYTLGYLRGMDNAD